MIANEILFLLSASFIGGVSVAQLFPSSLFITALIGAAFGAWGYLKGKHARYFFVGLIGVMVGFIYAPFYGHFIASGNTLPRSTDAFQGVVVGTLHISEKSQTILVSLSPPFQGVINIILAPIPSFRYGDILSIKGGPIRDVQTSQPFLPYPSVDRVGSGGGSPIRRFLTGIRDHVRDSFLLLFPKDSAALLGGLALGIQDDFSDAFKQAMARSGTTHLVALSGYNVSILAYTIFLILGSWLPRRVTLWSSIVLIIVFVLMVGATASVVRAAVMGILLIGAKMAGRLYNPRNAIAFAAAVMLIQNPTLIGSDIGFLLSFVSLCGVIYLSPALEALFHVKKDGNALFDWREVLMTTLGAQLAVVPILLAYFGGVSLVGIFSNMLLLEIVPFVMALGCFLGILAFIAMPLAQVAAWFIGVPLLYMRGVIYFFSLLGTPYGAGLFSVPLAVLYYVILLGIIIYGDEKRHRMIKLQDS